MEYHESIIKATFKEDVNVNFDYFPNLVCCFNTVDHNRKSKWVIADLILRDNKLIGMFDDFSEYIPGFVVGGFLSDEDYYVFVTEDNVYGLEYKFVHWDFIDPSQSLSIKDENGQWYIMEKKNNFKLIKTGDF